MLNLPFLFRESYRERLITLKLMPLCYWHEYLDLVLFYKAVTGQVGLSSALPQQIVNQRTRSSSNGVKFRSPRCKTLTHQRSFFSRVVRTWNTLPACLRSTNNTLRQFKGLLREYYFDALRKCYDPNEPKTWKTVCPKCNRARNLSNKLGCCY